MRAQHDQELGLDGVLRLLAERQAEDRDVAEERDLLVGALVAVVDEPADHHRLAVLDGDRGVGAATLDDGAAEGLGDVDGLPAQAADLGLHGHLHEAVRVDGRGDREDHAHLLRTHRALLAGGAHRDRLRDADALAHLDAALGVVGHHDARVGEELHAVLRGERVDEEVEVRAAHRDVGKAGDAREHGRRQAQQARHLRGAIGERALVEAESAGAVVAVADLDARELQADVLGAVDGDFRQHHLDEHLRRVDVELGDHALELLHVARASGEEHGVRLLVAHHGDLRIEQAAGRGLTVVAVGLEQLLPLAIGEPGEGLRDLRGGRVLQAHHVLVAVAELVGVEFLDHLLHGAQVVGRAAHQQAVGARVDGDGEFLAVIGHHVELEARDGGALAGALGRGGGRSALGGLRTALAGLEDVEIPLLAQAEQLVEDLQDALGLGVRQADHADVLRGAVVPVEVLDHLLDERHGVLGRAHDDGVGADVGGEADRLPDRGVDLHLGGLVLDTRDLLQVAHHGGRLRAARGERVAGEHAVDEADELEHVGALEAHVLDLHHLERLGRLEVVDDLAHGGDVGGGTGEDHRVGAAVDDGTHAVVAAAAVLLAHVHVVEHLHDVGGAALLELDGLEIAGERGVLAHGLQVADELLDDLRVLLARSHDERVGGQVALDGDAVRGTCRLAERGEALAHHRLQARCDGLDTDAHHGDDVERHGGVGGLLLDAVDEPLDVVEVGLRGGDQQAVGARVGHHQRAGALGHRLRKVRVAALHDLVDGGGHAVEVPALHGQHVERCDLLAVERVELADDALDHVERVGAARDEERVRLLVGEDGDLLQVGGARLDGPQAVQPRVHELLDERRQARGAGVLELHELEFAQVRGDLAVELLEELLQDGEAPLRGAHDQRVGAVVRHDADPVLGAEVLLLRLGVEELLQALRDAAGAGAREREAAHAGGGRGVHGVEALLHGLDQRHGLVAPGDDHRVGALDDGHGEVVRKRLADVSLRRAGERGARDPAERLALLEELLHDLGELVGVDVDERQDAHRHGAGGGDVVEHADEFARSGHVLLGAGDHD